MKERINKKYRAANICSIALWICLWQLAAVAIDNELFLPSPVRVWETLYKELLFREELWSSILTSFLHIVEGFLLGSVAGICLAVAAFLKKWIRVLLWVPIRLMKTVPVASFVILTLLWVKASELSVVIPFLMVLPTLYVYTLNGMEQIDEKLVEMTRVFGVSRWKSLRYLYIPQILPHVSAAASLAIGMAWKAGIAAEIIGLAQGTIGNRVYQSKLYLNTPELFAWTIIIVVLSILCEGVIGACMRLIKKLLV